MRPSVYVVFMTSIALFAAACHTDHRIGRAIRTAEDRKQDSLLNNAATVGPVRDTTLTIATSRASKSSRTKSGTYAYPTALTELPAGLRSEVAGIDVSHWDGKISWPDVSSEGIRFVYIKATEGLKYVDPAFAANWAGAGKTPLHRGAYHYFLPRLAVSQQVIQANNFIRTVKALDEGDLPPMIDFEDDPEISPELLQTRLFTFINEIEAWFRVTPIIYTSKGLYKKYLSWHNSFQHYEIWIAAYAFQRPELCDKRIMRIWQFTDKATIKGIPSRVDMNVFYTNSEDLKKLIIKK